MSGCASPSTPGTAPGGTELPRQTGPKRIVAAIYGDLPIIRSQINTITPGVVEIEALVNGGLATMDDGGNLQPQLADAVPTIENGLWKLLPDGRMETTWRIREGARWHDGAPFTAADVQFTIMDVGMDKDLPIFFHIAYDSISSVDAPDPRTVVVHWKRPFVDADKIVSTIGTTHPVPLPRHVLQRPFAEDKTALLQHPYWNAEFVGTGAFRVREYNLGISLVLEANEAYVEGRPRIDQIEIRFIPDVNALMANLLSGTVEMSIGRGISHEQGLQLREQWRGGIPTIKPSSWLAIFPQFVNPSPPVSVDVRFRRAMLHAMDRQQMVDTLMHGESAVAHTFLHPNEPEYREIEGNVVRYEYDPRQAIQLLDELGNVRGGDGMMRMTNGQPLAIQFQTTAGLTHQAAVLSISDFLKQVGVELDLEVLAPQRVQDREYRAQRPGFELARNPNGISAFLPRNHGSQTPLPENQFRRYTNKSRYMNAEFDGLIDRYFETVPVRERNAVLGQILRHMTENLNAMGVFYESEVMAIGHRLVNVKMGRTELSNSMYGAHTWDVKEPR
jgi:peptide/nickel transport system substrate-binding protein